VLLIRDPDLDLGSRILCPGSNPTTTTKEEERNQNFVSPFFAATNFTKLKTDIFLNRYRKKCYPIDKELYYFLAKKLSLSSQKYEFGPDPNLPHC
jgi:hypothetical protein